MMLLIPLLPFCKYNKCFFGGDIQSETVMLLRTKKSHGCWHAIASKKAMIRRIHRAAHHLLFIIVTQLPLIHSSLFLQLLFLLFIHLQQHIMNFEDIVDMDWLNSNTTNDNTLSPASIQDDQMATFPTANYCTDNALYAFSNPSLFWPGDLSAPTAADLGFKFDLQQPQSGAIASVPSDKQSTAQQPESKLPELVMPSTEHIKQLIEIAKQHLALREQQQKLQVQGEPTGFTPGALPIPALFATSATNPSTTSTMPNTVSPESLMKGVTTGDVEENTRNMGDNKKSSSSISGSSRATSVIPEETMTLEAYAESDGIDIKKLTPKERRQLRNKISARNFRVRRKGKRLIWRG